MICGYFIWRRRNRYSPLCCLIPSYSYAVTPQKTKPGILDRCPVICFPVKIENKFKAFQNVNVFYLQSTINLHQDNWIDQRFFPWPALASYCLDLIYIVYTLFLLISRPNIFPWFTKSRVAFSIFISVDSKPSLNLWTTNKPVIK